MIVESWTPDRRLQEFLPRLAVLAQPKVLVGDQEGVDQEFLKLGSGDDERRITILLSFFIGPHVDDNFPEWTALWVLRASGHTIGIADSRPKYPNDNLRRPAESRSTMTPLVAGHIVLFNSHRTHWMDRAPDSGLMIAAAYDFDHRPTREVVENRIYKDVAGSTIDVSCR